ncbi:hypothetical protein INR49_003051 [Caranx melampygus]|nr:hypothetical protein INR49_003051 [Caranx melampygus]
MSGIRLLEAGADCSELILTTVTSKFNNARQSFRDFLPAKTNPPMIFMGLVLATWPQEVASPPSSVSSEENSSSCLQPRPSYEILRKQRFISEVPSRELQLKYYHPPTWKEKIRENEIQTKLKRGEDRSEDERNVKEMKSTRATPHLSWTWREMSVLWYPGQHKLNRRQLLFKYVLSHQVGKSHLKSPTLPSRNYNMYADMNTKKSGTHNYNNDEKIQFDLNRSKLSLAAPSQGGDRGCVVTCSSRRRLTLDAPRIDREGILEFSDNHSSDRTCAECSEMRR